MKVNAICWSHNRLSLTGKAETVGSSYAVIAFTNPEDERTQASIEIMELAEPPEKEGSILTRDFSSGNIQKREAVFTNGEMLYTVTCTAPASLFKKIDSKYFRGMIDSFKLLDDEAISPKKVCPLLTSEDKGFIQSLIQKGKEVI